MFSELNWLGAVLFGLGVLVVGALTWWVIVQAARRRYNARDSGRSDFSRRLNSDDDGGRLPSPQTGSRPVAEADQ